MILLSLLLDPWHRIFLHYAPATDVYALLVISRLVVQAVYLVC